LSVDNCRSETKGLRTKGPKDHGLEAGGQREGRPGIPVLHTLLGGWSRYTVTSIDFIDLFAGRARYIGRNRALHVTALLRGLAGLSRIWPANGDKKPYFFGSIGSERRKTLESTKTKWEKSKISLHDIPKI